MKYSIVVPVYNEYKNLTPLFREIKNEMNKLNISNWEILFINDGSTDKSLLEMQQIKDENIVIINLKKNYGQAIALDAGFQNATGDIIISMDADLQNDPKDISRLLKEFTSKNLDVVCGWRKSRKDPLLIKVFTIVGYYLRFLILHQNIHDAGCTLRIYKKEIIQDLELWGEMHRYIVPILIWKGAKVREIPVNHRARKFGVSKYNWTKVARGLVDLMFIWFWKKFSNRPLHLFGIIGITIFLLSSIPFMWSVYLKFFLGTSLSDSAWLLLSFFMATIGIQLFTFGIIIDLQIKTYFNTSREKKYLIEEIIKNKE